ncbi:MAG: DNA-processing protein DprA, partial [Anaerolineae bacterium]
MISESWVALSLVRHIGHKTLDALLTRFDNSTDAILQAPIKELMDVHGVGQKTAQAIHDIDVVQVRLDLAKWQRIGVRVVPQYSVDYPQVLNSTDDPPLTLFAVGNYQPVSWIKAVAIVGTRQPSAPSRAFAQEIARLYGDVGWTVVSGLALGIDSAAHQGALQSRTGRTVAVLGGGVLNIYPTQNRELAEQLCKQGALLSESAPYASSSAPRLVTRNRIISGLCQHVIVVQSGAKGGAMYAARAAQQQGRRLVTVDAPYAGNQALIAQGAATFNPDDQRLTYEVKAHYPES